MLKLFRGFPSVKIINTDRVTNIAVNMEQIMPALKVTANPLMGPEPIHASTKAAMRVVTFASRIVIKARSYPELIAARHSRAYSHHWYVGGCQCYYF